MVSLSSASKLRPDLMGVHPRVYFTDAELAALRQRAHSSQKDLWTRALANVRALKGDPPPPPAETRRAQNEVAFAIAEAAFAYKIEGDKKYLDAARKYMDAAVSYDVWGYSYNKPNVDLAAGHLLYGMGVGYDLLYHDLSPEDRARYRDKIIKQAGLLYDYFKPKPGRTYSYSQNHVFIPVAGLGVAAYALYDEAPDAPQWATLARAIYDRVLKTYSPDGYYYEGVEYWIFATPWIIHYLDAHQHSTGENLFNQPGFRQMHLYVAHSMLPGGDSVFDFGDAFEGALSRAHEGEAYPRSHPDGHFLTNYNVLFDLAARFHEPEIQGVAHRLEQLGQLNAEEWWSLVWYDEKLPATPMTKLTPWHYFPDHEVVYWRTDWGAKATAIAFKCGPPEGHHTAALSSQFPDWHLEAGHSHPDANSFIVFAHGQYLTGDSGYAGVPLTAHHNTLLVDGHGQGNEGNGHNAWYGVPYDQLNGIRMTKTQLSGKGFDLEGEAASAYDPKLGLKTFQRHITLQMPDPRPEPGSDESLTTAHLAISDEIRSAQPHLYTELLHTDKTFETYKKIGAGDEDPAHDPDQGRHFQVMIRFEKVTVRENEIIHALMVGRLSIRVELPTDAVIKTEPNIVIAPGPPGAVDKGEAQERGQRLTVTTAKPADTASFRWQLEF